MKTPDNIKLAALTVLILTASCNRMEEIRDAAPVLTHSFVINAELPDISQDACIAAAPGTKAASDTETAPGTKDTETSPDTKGSLESYISASWKLHDSVSVVNLSTGKILGGSLVADRAGRKTTFSGTVSGSISKGNVIALVHPSLQTAEECDFNTRKAHLGAQTKADGVPLLSYSAFTAGDVSGTFTGLDLSFFYALSYIKINMAGLPSDATASKVTLRNFPNALTVSINSDATGFDFATDAERAAKDDIVIEGPFTTSASGTMTVAAGVMPSDGFDGRNIVVSIDSLGGYMASLPSAALASHKYYNTIAGDFQKISLPGSGLYGAYRINDGVRIDSYDDLDCSFISGQENGESDFSILNTVTRCYWTLKGIPSDAAEGTVFTARLFGNGIEGLGGGELENARVNIIESDGDFSKLWVRAGDYLFIVRK